jgi:hypothetical protein
MLGTFFRRARDHKLRVNKELNLGIDSPVSSGGLEKYIKNASFPWLPVAAALSLLTLSFFIKNIFTRN